ncbi:hypothetical protein [Granulicella sibirica]|uniref:VanZ-like domain-containing protein n=1 Tax=Granulicella sibirica TaxID=2479048 RepID=A0A4Q0T1S8_9BACT|nr:hypothetical protein [Granulicella sibirica]RXH57605.1 hypothetical protein GRAN_0915 [Granulicella sibirica]
MAFSAETNAPKSRSSRVPFILLGCVLFPALIFLSFLPESGKSTLHTMGRFHSLGHVLAFTVVAYVAGRASWSRQVSLVLFFVAILSGLAIEVGEHLIYGSSLEWLDIVTDSIGVLLGTILALPKARGIQQSSRRE